MSAPGWYDDGSGRQRWWDGQQWSNHYASDSAQPSALPLQNAGAHQVAPVTKTRPVLGFIGLGLAVVGTVLAFFPFTFAVALVILFAAFVVSLIGLFKKHTVKWPAITGMVLPPIGAVAGLVVVLAVIANGLADDPSVEAGPDATATSAPDAESPTEPEPGGNEFPIGEGYTMEMSIESVQLDPPPTMGGGEPSQLEYDLYWDNAQETGGHLAVVNMTIHNHNDNADTRTPITVSMLRADLTEIPSWGAVEAGYLFPVFNLEAPAGGSQTVKIGFVIPAAEIDTVVVETFLMEDIGEGHRVTAYQDNTGEGCKQLEGGEDDGVKLWSCLQKK